MLFCTKGSRRNHDCDAPRFLLSGASLIFIGRSSHSSHALATVPPWCGKAGKHVKTRKPSQKKANSQPGSQKKAKRQRQKAHKTIQPKRKMTVCKWEDGTAGTHTRRVNAGRGNGRCSAAGARGGGAHATATGVASVAVIVGCGAQRAAGAAEMMNAAE